MPVHVSINNWALFEINQNESSMVYYYSAKCLPYDSVQVMRDLRRVLNDALVSEGHVALSTQWIILACRLEIAVGVPQQTDGNACGVFECGVAINLSEGLRHSPHNMLLKRYELGSHYDYSPLLVPRLVQPTSQTPRLLPLPCPPMILQSRSLCRETRLIILVLVFPIPRLFYGGATWRRSCRRRRAKAIRPRRGRAFHKAPGVRVRDHAVPRKAQITTWIPELRSEPPTENKKARN